MIIGVPTEVKTDEYRVSLSPVGVRELVEHGHEVIVEQGAGDGSSIADRDYVAQGAKIAPNAPDIFEAAEMILGVKEPQPSEVAMLREGQILFTYLHLAPVPELAMSLAETGAICIAYETVENSRGMLPLLAPMSEIAGKLATQSGAFMLERPLGGRGTLLGGAPGVPSANVLVIGGGVVGTNASTIAIGMQANVFTYDQSIPRLRELGAFFGGQASTVYSSSVTIEERLPEADLVIGAVLVYGSKSPHVVTRKQLQMMKPGAVLVDVAIDQGGCFETSRPTTHSEPTFKVDGILHYCVANMPGAVPVTATHALTNATLPYVLQLADLGARRACQVDSGLMRGVNVARGCITSEPVAEAVGADYQEPVQLL